MPPLNGEAIRLFNVKFSPNLGDGLLSESLENALHELGASPDQTRSVDLAARTAYGPGAISRSVVLKALNALPGPVRRAAISVPLGLLLHRRWRPHYEANMGDAQAVVLGGGNLFADIDLNFPSKLTAVLDIASRRALPTAIYGVGVAGGWSPKGLAMIRSVLRRARPHYVSVRDNASKARFDENFADACGMQADVVRDPGILISRYVPQVESQGARPIGLCITSAISVSYHSDLNATSAELSDWYVVLAERMLKAGRPILLFTNGSPEDERFLDAIETRLGAAKDLISRRTVTTPTELAQLISSLGMLVAHRMHALIAGYSYGVPIFALAWDPKVNAFMDSVGLGGQIATATAGNLEKVDSTVHGLIGAGAHAAPETHTAVISQAFDDVGRLAASLHGAIAAKSSRNAT